ncbi:LOW QUALITY PROTEIN: zinc finger protein 800b [Chanos chanos]|uniref:LOW QUALITY PROTEIN: zinc finger protein 800b n=1 Tax=Chanos chanos TaxID=29144 RepID=A0A6J2V4J1_CHACN|nr:LOW QUALITY PROTEIN: zinc finger protein 800-like [Chanos chanos]
MDVERLGKPLHDKSCQTDDLCHGCPEPNNARKAPVYSIEPGDPPLLQQQLQTSKSGIQQIIECFRTGTTHLKHILLKEVDTIFECKLCRSLFRGLPNLITHKEYYCLSRLPEPADSRGDGKQSIPIKDLLEAIYPRQERQDYAVTLEPITGNRNAVFQHLHTKEGMDQQPGSDSPDRSSTVHLNQPSHDSENDAVEEHCTEGEFEVEEAEETNSEEEEEREETVEEAQKEGTNEGTNEEEEEEEEDDDEDDEDSSSGITDLTITCCMCGKDFNTRRGIRRHCRKMHQRRLDELRKFTETRTVPISLLSVVKNRSTGAIVSPKPNRKRCPVCFKTFATTANVRRHFDEVHRGLRRDLITPDIATKPGQPLSLEGTPPHQRPGSPASAKKSVHQQLYNIAACKCLLCQRKYSTQERLKRHLRIVHKIVMMKNAKSSSNDTQTSASISSTAKKTPNTKVTGSTETTPASSSNASRRGQLKRRKLDVGENNPASRKPKLSMGFDFKQLFCKLCKRQFSSRQNLTKHIELHTDNGNDIFIKFYRCPLCRYESRRKRDVLRHVSVVHKKPPSYLARIMPNLESRAVKKPAEVVLNNVVNKRGKSQTQEVNGRHEPAPPQNSRKQLSESLQSSTEVRVTKNFSLHACDMCGRAFAKKVYLESHKRSHRNATASTVAQDNRSKGVSTRSKALLW